MNRIFSIKTTLIIAVLFFCGCPVPPGVEKEAKPDIILQVAGLNLGNFNKRIEKKHISDLVRTLKNERVEILAVQKMTCYPGVSTRVNFIEEFKNQIDWRSAFGEMSNISGKQTGNAVFSSYPIVSNFNQSFDAVKTSKFEAALLAAIDAGVNTVTVVSAELPAKSTAEENMQCMRIINKSVSEKKDGLVLICGNLPSSESIRKENNYDEVTVSKQYNSAVPKVWFSSGGHIRVTKSRVVETDLGKLLIMEIGLLR